jgi:hypothetical protein
MVQFEFKINKISKLEQAKVAILDGDLLNGKITTNSPASLLHKESKIGLKIKGVVLGGSKGKSPNSLSIVVGLHEEAMKMAEEGDLLIGI